MKPEPLKGKIKDYFHFKENDVTSAVKWLKNELYLNFLDNYNQEETEKIIDKAFADVIKEWN